MNFRRIRGISIPQLLMAMGLVGGLAAVFGTLMKQMGQGQKAVEIKSAMASYRQRIQAATQSQSALFATRTGNPTLAACLTKCTTSPSNCLSDPVCPSSDVPIRISDAGGASLVPLTTTAGWLTDDSGQSCDPAAAPSTCRWRTKATFKALSADTMKLSFEIAYGASTSANASAGVLPVGAQSWSIDVPVASFGSGTDPFVTKGYVDAALADASSGACYTTSNAACATGFTKVDSHKIYTCVYMGNPAYIVGMNTSTSPCNIPDQTITFVSGAQNGVQTRELNQSTVNTCCRTPST